MSVKNKAIPLWSKVLSMAKDNRALKKSIWMMKLLKSIGHGMIHPLVRHIGKDIEGRNTRWKSGKCRMPGRWRRD